MELHLKELGLQHSALSKRLIVGMSLLAIVLAGVGAAAFPF